MLSSTFFTASILPLVWASPHLKRSCSSSSNFTVGQIVETSSGPISGHAATNYSEVSEYLGIPFAQPPVGDLRFAAPEKYTGSSLLSGAKYVSYFCQILMLNTSAEYCLRGMHALKLRPERQSLQQRPSHSQTSLMWESNCSTRSAFRARRVR